MERAIGILKRELKSLEERAEYFKKQIEYNKKELNFFEGKDFRDYIERTYNEFDKEHIYDSNREKIYCLRYNLEKHKDNLNSCYEVIEEVKTAIKILAGKSD